jgi:CheY-like chemotaxis protein
MKKKIFLIDDNPLFLKVLSDLLSEDFLVETADSGQKAIDVFKASEYDTAGCSEPFDLIITDLIMPGLNGYAVAQFVKGENRKNKFTPIILLSGTEITKEEARKHGCAAYVPKTNLKKVVSMARILLHR